mmetsp:Transcript_27317/g.85039  ORF Transcript_27317/g.85039 Transcript_27317/m.85039 type:complete len:268 (-) Transcript_27317:69-872(-)
MAAAPCSGALALALTLASLLGAGADWLATHTADAASADALQGRLKDRFGKKIDGVHTSRVRSFYWAEDKVREEQEVRTLLDSDVSFLELRKMAERTCSALPSGVRPPLRAADDRLHGARGSPPRQQGQPRALPHGHRGDQRDERRGGGHDREGARASPLRRVRSRRGCRGQGGHAPRYDQDDEQRQDTRRSGVWGHRVRVDTPAGQPPIPGVARDVCVFKRGAVMRDQAFWACRDVPFRVLPRLDKLVPGHTCHVVLCFARGSAHSK